MKKRLRFSLTFTCLLFICLAGKSLFAQFPQTLEIGPHGGITTYQGDINPLKLFNQFSYDYGGLIRYNYDTRWSFRFDYTRAVMKATDQKANWRPERELGFRTKLNDFALIAEFNFDDYYTGRREASFAPYFFVGISYLGFKVHPYVDDIAQLYEKAGIRELTAEEKQNERYVREYDSVCKLFKANCDSALICSGTSFSIPFGIGCKMSLTKNLGATLEWRMHYTMTDLLDNVTDVYPDPNNHQLFVATSPEGTTSYGQQIYKYEIVNGNPDANAQSLVYDVTDPTGRYVQGQQRGDASTNDWFGVLNLSITWKIPIPGNTACKIIN